MNISQFTEKQINFIIKNYPSKGGLWCSKELNIDTNKIRNKAYSLGLKITKECRSKLSSHIYPYNKYNVNPEQFLNITTPEVAYILGFLWADGSLAKTKKDYHVRLAILKTDMDDILNVFNKLGKWTIYNRTQKDRKPTTSLSISNKAIYNFLIENNYGNKSGGLPDKILSKIPENLKHYWFRGLFDGDGCIFVDSSQKRKSLSIHSTFDQDWKYIFNLAKKLNIKKIRISKRDDFGSKKSSAYLNNYKDIFLLLEYIYRNYENDKIGLIRKYNKYQEIVNMQVFK